MHTNVYTQKLMNNKRDDGNFQGFYVNCTGYCNRYTERIMKISYLEKKKNRQ